MKKNYKMILQYDGSRYDGWQKQGNTGNTIQEKLEHIFKKLTGSAAEVIGSGRTDAGVHAKGQTANVHLDTEMSVGELKNYVNRYLPEDISVTEMEEVAERFHSRLNARSKVYTYRIETSDKKPVFQRKYIYGLGEVPDLDAMKTAAEQLCGTHDFRSFCSNKNMKKSTVRTLESISFHEHGSQIEVEMKGDGFLYHMVRILVGTLVEVGQGKRRPDTMAEVLEAKDRQAAGYTAPAEGLFLTAVFYD